jgi:hypothetical protein
VIRHANTGGARRAAPAPSFICCPTAFGDVAPLVATLPALRLGCIQSAPSSGGTQRSGTGRGATPARGPGSAVARRDGNLDWHRGAAAAAAAALHVPGVAARVAAGVAVGPAGAGAGLEAAALAGGARPAVDRLARQALLQGRARRGRRGEASRRVLQRGRRGRAPAARDSCACGDAWRQPPISRCTRRSSVPYPRPPGPRASAPPAPSRAAATPRQPAAQGPCQ